MKKMATEDYLKYDRFISPNIKLRFVMCVLRVYLYNLFELCKTELGVKLYAFAEKKVNFIVMSVIGIEVKPKETDLYSKSYIPPHHTMSCPPLHFCNF
jgi:hypothetical protein